MPEFEKYFDPATTPVYLNRIVKEIAFRLMSKGFGVNLIATDERTSIMSINNSEGHGGVFCLEFIDDINITWRRII